MFRQSRHPAKNFRFRTKSEDPRKDDVVGSVPYSLKELKRRRLMRTLLMVKCGLITVLCLLVLTYAAKVWRESMTANPNFAVNDFNFSSNIPAERGGLTRDTVLEVTELRPEVNVMQVNLPALQASLLQLPQVSEVNVQRYFPNRIDIRITERQPVAWLVCIPKNIRPRDTVRGRFVDATGMVFECRTLLNQYSQGHLAELHIPELAWVETGKPLADKRAMRALALLEKFNQQTWCVPLRIKEVHVKNDYALETLLTDGSQITFSADQPEKQCRRLAMIYEWAKQNDRLLATAQLVAEKNTPVTFVTRQSQAAAAATPPKTSPVGRVVPTNHAVSTDSADIKAISRGR